MESTLRGLLGRMQPAYVSSGIVILVMAKPNLAAVTSALDNDQGESGVQPLHAKRHWVLQENHTEGT